MPSKIKDQGDLFSLTGGPALLGLSALFLVLPFAGHAVIRGEDGRIEADEAPNSQLKMQSDATVAIFDRKELFIALSKVRLKKTESLGEYWNLCPGQRFRTQPTNSFCSGALVGPDLILTAGHCVSKSGSTLQSHCRKNLRFVFDYKMQSANSVASIAASEVYSCREVVAFKKEIRNDLEYADFALIRLDRRVRNRTPLGVNRSGLPVDLRATLTMIGYPAGIPQKIALGGSVKGSVAGQPFFTANLDSLGGNSGSPVINEATGLIEGILGGKVTTRTSPGDMDFVISPKNEDCLIENQKTEAEALGDLVTRISEVTEAIPNLK